MNQPSPEVVRAQRAVRHSLVGALVCAALFVGTLPFTPWLPAYWLGCNLMAVPLFLAYCWYLHRPSPWAFGLFLVGPLLVCRVVPGLFLPAEVGPASGWVLMQFVLLANFVGFLLLHVFRRRITASVEDRPKEAA